MKVRSKLRRAVRYFTELFQFYFERFVSNPLFIIPLVFVLLLILFNRMGYIALISLIPLILAVFANKKLFSLFLSLAVALVFAFVAIIFCETRRESQLKEAVRVAKLSNSQKYEILVLTRVKKREDSQNGFVKINGTNAYVSLPRYPEAEVGSRCVFEGDVDLIDVSDTHGFNTYLRNNYTYLSGKGRIKSCTEQGSVLSAITYVFSLKREYIHYIEFKMKEPYASLFIGILFGDDRVYTPEFEKMVQVAGIAHVVAASGYNIQFVEKIGGKLFAFINFKYRKGLVVALVWIYALIAGLGASVVRAALSSSLYVFASLIHYPLSSYWNLTVTIFLMLLINPMVLYDIGFQLSILATFSIIYVAPVMEYMFRVSKEMIIPFLCTLFTSPVLIINFNSFSVVAPLASILALWSIDNIMYLGLFVAVFKRVFEDLALIVISIAENYIWCFTKIVEFVSNLSVANYRVSPVVLYILILITIGLYLYAFRKYIYNH